MEKLLYSREEILQDTRIKRERVRAFLIENEFDGVIITSREQFAWVTSGGDNHVVRNSNLGFGALVITKDRHFLVAHTMDGDRLVNEQVEGQGYMLVPLRWYEGDIRIRAVELAGEKAASDTDFDGAVNVFRQLTDLHYPMTGLEIARLRWLGKTTDQLFYDFASSVKPGETERDIAARLHCAHLTAGLEIDVLIVGSDERCFKYRHPLPTNQRLDRYLMLHTVARRWGLHCNLTRFVHFGNPPKNVRKVYEAATNVAAKVILSLRPGLKFANILSLQKNWYAEEGFPDEWKKHFQGGPTGYVIVDAERCLTEKVLQLNQPFEWFITVTGTKFGELVVLSKSGTDVFSYDHSLWPEKVFRDKTFGTIALPDIFIR